MLHMQAFLNWTSHAEEEEGRKEKGNIHLRIVSSPFFTSVKLDSDEFKLAGRWRIIKIMIIVDFHNVPAIFNEQAFFMNEY